MQLKQRQKDLSEELDSLPEQSLSSTKCITRDAVAAHLAAIEQLARKAKDKGKGLVQSLVENQGLQVRLTDESSLHVTMLMRPPGVGSDEAVEHSVQLEAQVLFPTGKVDRWLRKHENKVKCKICGKPVVILRRHYWYGLPQYHHRCWASRLTAKRSNPDADRYYNGRQVAELFGVGQSTVCRWIKTGKLAPIEKRSGVNLFDKKAIDASLLDHR